MIFDESAIKLSSPMSLERYTRSMGVWNSCHRDIAAEAPFTVHTSTSRTFPYTETNSSADHHCFSTNIYLIILLTTSAKKKMRSMMCPITKKKHVMQKCSERSVPLPIQPLRRLIKFKYMANRLEPQSAELVQQSIDSLQVDTSFPADGDLLLLCKCSSTWLYQF